MTFEEEMAAARATFVVEAGELLLELEAGLLGLEADGDPDEIVNAIFRAAHTIKGSAGLFGLDEVVDFTHTVETVLDLLRTGDIAVSSELIGALLPCGDHIADLIQTVAAGGHPATEHQLNSGATLLARLTPFLATALPPSPPSPTTAPTSTLPPSAPDSPKVPSLAGARPREVPPANLRTTPDLHLSLRFGVDCLRNGMDPLSFIGYLSTLGTVIDLLTLPDAIPEAEQMDAESNYLSFEATLRTQATVEAVEGVFDFVADEGDIRILVHGSDVGPFAELVASYHGAGGSGGANDAVAEFLTRSGAVDGSALRAALLEQDGERPTQLDDESDGSPSGPDLIPATRTARADTGAGAANAENRSIRVDAPRLDRLIDVVGELVIAGSAAGLRASMAGNDALLEATGEVMRLVEEVRASALQLRMVPIGTTFSRFQRVVRDVSTELGKDIALVISGGDTEVDKALVERIGDPLMHLVRNSMDHGIESASARLAAGKPARGTLRLNAFHDSGNIVIEVQDDGGGIDRDRVLAKAIERGLVDPEANLSPAEVDALIFEPGFSTAAQISSLSGRGVGMDVVKRNVTSLRGTIDVENRPGEGSTMRIRLPLTLAIIDGFLVGVGASSFVVPLDRVLECVELPASPGSARHCMDLRGEVLPFIRLRSLFSISGDRPRRENVIVVDYAGMKIGLVVDQLIGEFQTVIKPLGVLFEHVQGISGSTILGSGEVALIIDVPELIRHHGDQQTDPAGNQQPAGPLSLAPV